MRAETPKAKAAQPERDNSKSNSKLYGNSSKPKAINKAIDKTINKIIKGRKLTFPSLILYLPLPAAITQNP
jgi:hypothetical protein